MTTKRMVVFSGFTTRFAERAKSSLLARQIQPIFVSTSNGLGELYFETLLARLLSEVKRILSSNDIKISGLIASSIENETVRTLERDAFFPSMRRLGFPEAFAADVNRVNQVVQAIFRTLASDMFLSTYEFVRPPAGVLCLPLLNADSPRLRNLMGELYELRSFQPDGSLYKEVVRQRRGRGVRIKGIDFAGRINNDRHPVRRCTDSTICDVAARLRLGFSLPERFEFDVSSEQGIAGKEFLLCDGTVQKIPAWADHLNMRINNDFKCGSRH